MSQPDPAKPDAVAARQADDPAGAGKPEEDREALSLPDAVNAVLGEARMILPGTQTLFGFQLIVVFNARFQERLSVPEQYAHLVATALVLVAMAMLVTPAAFHRRAEPRAATRRFVALADRLLYWSLAPLAVAVTVEFYLVATLVTQRQVESMLLAAAILAVFAGLWFVLPHRAARDDGA